MMKMKVKKAVLQRVNIFLLLKIKKLNKNKKMMKMKVKKAVL
jgi:hypothetical protein